MPDREKIIKALECCRWDECKKCQYHGQSDCFEKLLADALALLKAQEAVRPIRVNGRWIKYYACGACKKQLGSNDSRDSYCRHCGRAVKWDD